MLKVPIFGFHYARLLADYISAEEIAELKRDFSYLFAVIYGSNPRLTDVEVQKRQVFVIDLTQGIKRIFDNFKKNTRNEIRRAEHDPVLSFISDDGNWEVIYERYKKFEQGRHWMPSLKAEFKRSVLFSAFYKNNVIAGVACYGHSNILRVSKIFSIRNHNTLPNLSPATIGHASRKLIFDVCRYGIENNYSRLDLGGVNFNDSRKIGISKFKQSFGGTLKDTYIVRSMTPSFFLFKKFLALVKRDIT